MLEDDHRERAPLSPNDADGARQTHDARHAPGARDAADQPQVARDAAGIEQFDLFGAPILAGSANGEATGPAAASKAAGSASAVRAATFANDDAAASTRSGQRTSKPTVSASLWDEPAPAGAAPPDNDNDASDTPQPSVDQSPKRRTRAVLAAAPTPQAIETASRLPPHVHIGTSTWSFPGWRDIVYGDDYSDSKLSRDGLTAYGAHPLLRTVSIDRSFYAPLSVADYLRYAQQVPAHFRFIVKAPSSVTDATVRAERGEPVALNPCFLNAQLAADEFVRPCIEGLGDKAGALVFQFSPLPDQMLADPAAFIERLAGFFAALPALPPGPCYAIEIRDGALLTPRLVRMLRAANVRYCVGVHARMPDILRQAAALALMDGEPAGPLIVRWSLHSGFRYEQAKAKYEPFNQLIDEDPNTRRALAELAARYAIAGQPVLIAVNNKAEGSAPLTCFELARGIAEAWERLKAERGEGAAGAPGEAPETAPDDAAETPDGTPDEAPRNTADEAPDQSPDAGADQT